MILQYTQILNSKKRFIHSKGTTCCRVFFEWKDRSLLQPSDGIYMSSEFSLLFPEVWGLEASGEVAETLVNCCLVAKSCLTLCDPMDCSSPGSSVHEISQTRILEWIAISFSRRSCWLRDWTHVSCIGRKVLYHWATLEVHNCRLEVFKCREETVSERQTNCLLNCTNISITYKKYTHSTFKS